MITDLTVFIVGAGAHMPYGFPSGEKLKTAICGLSASRFHARDGREQIIDRYLNDLSDKLRKASTQSIDAFFQHNKQLAELGRICVAFLIKQYESQSENSEVHDWIEWLVDKPLNARLDDFSSNKVAFVTFNYDRFLEQRLMTLLAVRHGDEHKARAVVRSLPIIHVHGSIGRLACYGERYGDDSLEFGVETDYSVTCRASSTIRFYDEEGFAKEPPSHRSDLERAIQLIAAAHNVFFLGFSYQKDNLSILKWNDLPDGKYVDGTAFGETIGRISRIRQTVFKYETSSKDSFERCPTAKDWTAYDFVKNCEPLLAFAE